MKEHLSSHAARVEEQRIGALLSELQDALNTGWKDWEPSNPRYMALRQLYDNTREPWPITYAENITHPQHMELARLIGERFVEKCAQNGIALGRSFPGNFRESRKLGNDQSEARRFEIPVYLNGDLVGNFQVDFPQDRKKFGFTGSPQLSYFSISRNLPMAQSKKCPRQDR